MTVSPNPATAWAETFVAALSAAGLRDVCISPGSRSTPLTLAFAAHGDMRVRRFLDERGAAFFALGLAQASGRPAAVVCTSGTATVNYHPAVVEAYQAGIPLLVLTADRPPELRHSGANQTVDQVKQFGDHVLWTVDLGAPEPATDPPASVAWRNVAAIAARALALTQAPRPGPVHVNLPFRKPLEPTPNAARPPRPAAPRVWPGVAQPSADSITHLATAIAAAERGLIVAGPRCPGGAFPAAVHALSARAGFPIVTDPLSGLRFGPGGTATVTTAETLYAGARDPLPLPDFVLRFGAVPTSKWLNAMLARAAAAGARVVQVAAHGVWADDQHITTDFYPVDPSALCRAVSAAIDGPAPTAVAYGEKMRSANRRTARAIAAALSAEPPFDAHYVTELVAALPAGARFVIGNSLPVRHIDQFGAAREVPLRVFANRGASGIDGVVATALGVAAASGDEDAAPLTALLIGDVSLLHDLNSLLNVQYAAGPVAIVLLNNDGGGIFGRLPIRAFDPPYTDLFRTPHGTDFAPLVRALGWHHVNIDDPAALRPALDAVVADGQPTVIEVRTDPDVDEAARRRIVAAATGATDAR